MDKEKFFEFIGTNLDEYPKYYKVLTIPVAINPTELEMYLPSDSKLSYVIHKSTWDQDVWCMSCIRGNKLPEPLRDIDGHKEYEDKHKQLWVNKGLIRSFSTFAEFDSEVIATAFASSCNCYQDTMEDK